MNSTIDIVSADPGIAAAPKAQEAEARKMSSVEAVEERQTAAKSSEERRKTEARAKDEDRVELRFALNRDERAALADAFAAKGDVSGMSEEEQEILRKASERISKGIDDAMAKNAENRKWVEKAVTEWYASIAKGDEQGATDLISLLRRAAMGNLEGMNSSL